MSLTLLQTKLYLPPLRLKIVSRPNLIKRLHAGLERKFTLISAPAGFGKTTFICEWAGKYDLPIAWVSLDEGDNDPARFWAYFVAALQSIHKDLGLEILPALLSPQPPPIQSLLAELINEINEIKDIFVLVLDDFHIITENAIHDGVNLILENQPPSMHLILASRADPPWPLSQFRARREMNELRADDLRFTFENVREFLNEIMKLDLSMDDISALVKHTEGWIVGLQMAALSINKQKDQSGFIKAFTGTNRYILDYLLEEVLDQQPAEIQDFLLKTSVLDRMSGSLCDAMLNKNGSQNILQELERANLFLISLDDNRRWFRYHHLFLDLLRNQLNLMYPDAVPNLHLHASKWFEEHMEEEQAAAHAFASGDVDQVARVVEKYGRGMLHQSKHSTLLEWIEALPMEIVRNKPWLCVYHAWTRHWAGLRTGGEACLARAEELLERNDSYSVSERNILAGNIATVQAHYALVNGQLNKVIEQARLALGLLRHDSYARGTAAIALGGAYWGVGDAANAEKAFLDCSSYALEGGYNMRASSALCYAGMQQVKRGDLLLAERTFTRSLDLAQGPRGMRYPNAGYPLVKLGELFCERNKLEQADRYIREGVVLCEELGHVDLIAEAYAALAKIQLAMFDYKGVEETLLKADRLTQKTALDPWAVTWLDHCRVRLWLAKGNLRAALQWARTNGPPLDGSFSYHHDLHHAILARILIDNAEKHPSNPGLEQAAGLISGLIAAAEKAGWIHEKIQFLLLQALAYEVGGLREKALGALAQALDLAEPSGYLRVFLDEGVKLEKLFDCLQTMAGEEILKNHQFTPGYVNRIISAFRKENQGILRERFPDIPDPLTPREIEVLGLLDTSLTTPEIAAKLVVSANTVRSHVKHIYNKLDVSRRLDAVRKAKELKII